MLNPNVITCIIFYYLFEKTGQLGISLITVDGFISMGSDFRGLNKFKMTHSWGSKFLAVVFSFIIHTENH